MQSNSQTAVPFDGHPAWKAERCYQWAMYWRSVARRSGRRDHWREARLCLERARHFIAACAVQTRGEA